MIDFHLNDSQYDDSSDFSFESASDDESDSMSNSVTTFEHEVSEESTIFTLARNIADRGYRHRSLRRASSIF